MPCIAPAVFASTMAAMNQASTGEINRCFCVSLSALFISD